MFRDADRVLDRADVDSSDMMIVWVHFWDGVANVMESISLFTLCFICIFHVAYGLYVHANRYSKPIVLPTNYHSRSSGMRTSPREQLTHPTAKDLLHRCCLANSAETDHVRCAPSSRASRPG